MRKLQKWVKVVAFLLLLITIYNIFTKKTVVNEVGKNYTCYGSFIQVCSGDNYDL